MRFFLASTLVNAIVMYILARIDIIHVDNLLPAGGGFITQDGAITLVIAAVIMGIMNSILKPILNLLALPITCLTLGLFLVITNGIVFYAGVSLAPHVSVGGFWMSVGGGILFGILNSIIGGLLGVQKKKEEKE